MAIVLNSNPPSESFSIQGDMIYVVYESIKANDSITYPNYKYVCDIYINTIFIARLYAFPDPENFRGIFNIYDIVRTLILTKFNPTPNSLLAQIMGVNEFFLDIQCKFGEEYADTTYLNLLTDIARRGFNYYYGLLVNAGNDLFDFPNRVISNRPSAQDVLLSGHDVFVPYYSVNNEQIDVEIKTYNDNNVLVATQSTSFIPAPPTTTLQQFNVSPSAINATFAGLIISTTKYYTVQIDSDLLRFNIVCNPKYENFCLHFLNKYAGFESFIFNKVSRKKIDIERKEYSQLPYKVDGSGVVSYFNNNNVYHDIRTTYSTQFKEKMVLNSDLLDDNTHSWLSELVLSPMVYIQIGVNYVPISIVRNNYEFKKIINDKLTNLTLDIEFGKTLNAQSR